MTSMNTCKKFQFFDIIEGDPRSLRQCPNYDTSITYKLNDVNVLQMKNISNYIFMSVQHKQSKPNSIIKLLKMYTSKPWVDYEIYSKEISCFEILSWNSDKILLSFGIDKSTEEQGNKSSFGISNFKIFNLTPCVDTNIDKDPEIIRCLSIMFTPDNKSIYSGNSPTQENKPITGINSFSISSDLSIAALGLNTGEIIVLIGKPNLVEVKDNNSIKVKLIKKQGNDPITNVAIMKYYNNSHVLIYSTLSSIYKINIVDDKIEEPEVIESDYGIRNNCLNIKESEMKFIIATSTGDNYLTEYDNFDKVASWGLEGDKYSITYFKNYLAFVSSDIKDKDKEKSDDIASYWVVYDTKNRIYAYKNNNALNSRILGLTCDADTIFIITEEIVSGVKSVYRLKEKDNKEKFDTFYKKSFYDTAYIYAKNLDYDQKKLSEISKKHAEHLYQKTEYLKSIEQYIRTIGYLDPSYVIQQFLDGSKLDFWISYLEAIHSSDLMHKKSTPEEMKDYTALLLNCYIKQKKFKKLKDFVDQKNINDQWIDIETAIEVCKDTQQTDLALSIATKSNMVDACIQIMMDIKNDYKEALDYLKREKNVVKKFKMFLKYGEKFLSKNSIKDTIEELKKLIGDIIQIKNGTYTSEISQEDKDELKILKYESIISIFINKENHWESLLDFIMKNDENCPALILHRRIELYLDQAVKTPGTAISDQIKKIILNEKYQKIIDKNYWLMLFKMQSGYVSDLITSLSEIMDLKHELLQSYMDCHYYDKIIELCEKNGKVESNCWIQALKYFISIYNIGSNDKIIYNIELISGKMFEQKTIAPIWLMDLLKQGKNLPFETIKSALVKHIKQEQKDLNDNKTQCEENTGKIDKYNAEIKELQQKAKSFTSFKSTVCSDCNRQLTMPAVYFCCNHAYHLMCLNGQMRDDTDEMECFNCKNRKDFLALRIKQFKDSSKNHNEFYTELAGSHKKFDKIGEYLGKGIFDVEKDLFITK